MNKINVVLADDHALIRAGYRSILDDVEDINLIGEASDGVEAIQQALDLNPDIIILDITMPNKNGLDAAKEIKTKKPHIKILMLSMHKEEAYIKKSIENGADGYLVKDTNSEHFINAIRTLHKGEKYYGETSTKVLLDSFINQLKQTNETTSNYSLSPREKEVLTLVSKGKTSSEIADLLFISKRTVDNHRSNIMQKLDVHSVAELIAKSKNEKIV